MYVFQNRTGKLRLANSVQRKNSFMSENVRRPNFKIVKGRVGVGSGTYGDVYAGYSNMSMRSIRVVKELKGAATGDEEVRICRKIYSLAPRHVIRIVSSTKRSLELDMYRGGAIGDWLKKVKGMTDNVMRVLILQVLDTLYRIHQKDPSFRHNDLHLGNIFVDDRYVQDRGEKLHSYKIPPFGIRLVLADFGLSGDNQYPIRENFPDYGIYQGSDEMYDVHLFLNSLLNRYAKKRESQIPMTVKFLEEVLKGGFSGETNTQVKHYRLKSGTKFPYDFLMLMNHFYFSVPLLSVARIPRKTDRNSKLKMYKLKLSNIRSWGGSYSPIEAPLYEFVLKNLGGGGAPPSPILRRNPRLSPILEGGVTHPYRAWSPMYRKRPIRSPIKVLKKSPVTRKPKARLPSPVAKKSPSPVRNLESNIKNFLKNKNFTKVTVKNIRLHLEPKHKDKNLKAKIKTIVDTRIMPLYKPLSPLTPIPIDQRVKTFQKGKARFEPEKVRKYLKNTGEYKNENINKYFKKIGPAPAAKKSELLKFISDQGVKVLPAAGTQTTISPGGRLRLGKKLCMAYKKDELVDFAKRAKVDVSGTKEALCARLRASKFIPV